MAGSYFFLDIGFPCHNWKMPMEKQISEVINSMIFPVVHSCAKVHQCLISQFSINCSVGLHEYSVRRVDTGGEIGFCSLICARVVS